MTPLARQTLLAVAAVAPLLAAAAALADTAADPWSQVPSLPTACYSEADQHWAASDAAVETLRAAIDAQQAANTKVKEAFDSIDPMEKAQRMSQWMMEHPDEAQAYMQHVSDVGQNTGAAIEEWAARVQAIDAEKQELAARYAAALEQAYAPAEARHRAMLARAEREGVSVDGEGTPPWATEEWNAIGRERDRAYAEVCPAWWGASGQVQSWLARYKIWLIEEDVPVRKQQDDEQLRSVAILGTPAATYRSTALLEGVAKYVEEARGIYGQRPGAPRCPPGRAYCN